jgi:hypothetical protein
MLEMWIVTHIHLHAMCPLLSTHFIHKLEWSDKSLVKLPNIVFHEYSFYSSQVVTCGEIRHHGVGEKAVYLEHQCVNSDRWPTFSLQSVCVFILWHIYAINIEICSRDYATVDEMVFAPCWAELSHAAINTWIMQEWGRVTWRHAPAVTQQLKRFPTCQIKGL